MIFTEILSDLGIEYKEAGEHHHVTQGWVGIDCPYCGLGSEKYKLGYNISYGYLSCWSCGSHGLLSTLRQISSRDESSLRSLLGELDTQPKQTKVRGTLKLPKGIGPLAGPHRRYLLSRRLNPDSLARKWGIGGLTLSPRLNWRIFIPIHSEGKVVSWTTRSISDSSSPRYLSAKHTQEEISSKSILYGEDHARGAILIHEGPFDVFSIGYGAVCTLGVGYSLNQLIRMSRFPKRTICFDSDSEAQRRARKLSRELSDFPGVTQNITLDYKDICESPINVRKEVRKRFLS